MRARPLWYLGGVMTPARSALKVIDSHTGGEPTRVVVEGAPDLGGSTLSLAQRREVLRRDHDWVRSAIANEPRAADFAVGALLCEPHEPDCVAGVIFFNNVGYLNMCIHGTIGLAVTLVHLGRIGVGEHRIDTPVGVVTAIVHDGHTVTVANVPSYRHAAEVKVEVPGHGAVTGDIAWGGNWFFLIDGFGPAVRFGNIEALTGFTAAVREALATHGITGADGGEIDHIETFGPPLDPAAADSKNFVLCPGKAYDRSPCGTGTSAKLACLHARGRLAPGETWRQASILDTVFEGQVEEIPGQPGRVIPRVTGTAFVNGEVTVLFHANDPFAFGIPVPGADAGEGLVACDLRAAVERPEGQ